MRSGTVATSCGSAFNVLLPRDAQPVQALHARREDIATSHGAVNNAACGRTSSATGISHDPGMILANNHQAGYDPGDA
jgi:hypothetical protein